MTDEQRRTNGGVGLNHPTVVPDDPDDDEPHVLRDLELTEVRLVEDPLPGREVQPVAEDE